jgi:hypothetical protein
MNEKKLDFLQFPDREVPSTLSSLHANENRCSVTVPSPTETCSQERSCLDMMSKRVPIRQFVGNSTIITS